MSHHRPRLEEMLLTRREMLRRTGMGFGMLGLAGLLGTDGLVGTPPLP